MLKLMLMVNRFFRMFRRLQEGQGMMEYALILGLVSIVAIAALALLGPKIKDIFDQIVKALG